MTPHFAAAYGVRSGNPKRPAAEDRFVMLALALCLSNGIALCAHRNCPVRLTASVRSQSRTAMSSHAAVGPAIPALLTSVARPPSARRTSWKRRATEAASATSQVLRERPGSLFASALSAASSTSQTCPRAAAGGREADAGSAGGDQYAQSLQAQVHRCLDPLFTCAVYIGTRVDYNCDRTW